MNPVTIGAAIPDSWLLKFMIPPTVPTLSRGAINDGIDQPTGAAMESPVSANAIHATAPCAECAYGTPKMHKPTEVPPKRTVCRTPVAFHPRWISESVSHPPTANSATVAHNHGTLVYKKDRVKSR